MHPGALATGTLRNLKKRIVAYFNENEIVPMYVCMYVCMYVSMYVRVYVCMHANCVYPMYERAVLVCRTKIYQGS